MKKLEEMSDLERCSLARWIRLRMQGRVGPTILAEPTDQELLLQYFQNQLIPLYPPALRVRSHSLE
jgi:hypothetical protein